MVWAGSFLSKRSFGPKPRGIQGGRGVAGCSGVQHPGSCQGSNH